MTLTTTQKLTAFVATMAAVGAFVSWFGGIFQSPGERLTAHVKDSRVTHDSIKVQAAIAHEHDETLEKLMEGLVRGECLENSRANLARQGLLKKCQDLGINPQ